MRLVADVGKEQKASSEKLQEIQSLTRERDLATQKLRENDLEVHQMQETLKCSQEALTMTRNKLVEHETRLVVISLFMYHVRQGRRRSWFSTASYLLLFSATLAQTFLIFRSLLMNFFIELYNYENNFNYTVDLFPNFSVCSFC